MPKLMMPANAPESDFTGIGNYGAALKGAIDGATPFVQEAQELKQMGIQDQQKSQALEYQKLLRTGADGMRKYAQEIGNEFPELGQQLAHEAEQYAQFMQDPSLTGDKAEEYAHNYYSSADSRVKAIKAAKEPKPTPAWAPTTKEEAYDFEREKAELKAENETPKVGRGSTADAARAEKRMNALRQLPGIWAQIEELQTGTPVETREFTDPVTKQKASAVGKGIPIQPNGNPDNVAFMTGLDNADESGASSKRLLELRKQLISLEADAGLEATKDIMGPGRDTSASYKLYAGGSSAGPATVARPAAPSKPRNTIKDAEDWLKDPKNKGAKQYPAILAEVQKARKKANGL